MSHTELLSAGSVRGPVCRLQHSLLPAVWLRARPRHTTLKGWYCLHRGCPCPSRHQNLRGQGARSHCQPLQPETWQEAEPEPGQRQGPRRACSMGRVPGSRLETSPHAQGRRSGHCQVDTEGLRARCAVLARGSRRPVCLGVGPVHSVTVTVCQLHSATHCPACSADHAQVQQYTVGQSVAEVSRGDRVRTSWLHGHSCSPRGHGTWGHSPAPHGRWPPGKLGGRAGLGPTWW